MEVWLVKLFTQTPGIMAVLVVGWFYRTDLLGRLSERKEHCENLEKQLDKTTAALARITTLLEVIKDKVR